MRNNAPRNNAPRSKKKKSPIITSILKILEEERLCTAYSLSVDYVEKRIRDTNLELYTEIIQRYKTFREFIMESKKYVVLFDDEIVSMKNTKRIQMELDNLETVIIGIIKDLSYENLERTLKGEYVCSLVYLHHKQLWKNIQNLGYTWYNYLLSRKKLVVTHENNDIGILQEQLENVYYVRINSSTDEYKFGDHMYRLKQIFDYSFETKFLLYFTKMRNYNMLQNEADDIQNMRTLEHIYKECDMTMPKYYTKNGDLVKHQKRRDDITLEYSTNGIRINYNEKN